MCRPQHNLFTKDQLQVLFAGWQCTEPIPRKGQKVVIAFAKKTDVDVDLIEVELTQLKGTYGDRLYRTTMSSSAGRAIELSANDSHVVTFRQYQAKQKQTQL